MSAPVKLKEAKIDLAGCEYHHSNPALVSFLSKYRFKTLVKFPGKAAELV